MNLQLILIITLIVLGGGLASGYAFWNDTFDGFGFQRNAADPSAPAGMHRMSDGSLMHNGHGGADMGMMGAMDHGMMVVESERAFLEGMIPHHQEAVDTAREVVARGGSTPEIKKLAEDIIRAQEQEIAMMKAWYQTWYGETYTQNPETYQPMMRDLSGLSGAALDQAFLEDMIMHHMGAIMMANSVQPHIEHEEVAALTRAIIETQTAEIQLMRELIATITP